MTASSSASVEPTTSSSAQTPCPTPPQNERELNSSKIHNRDTIIPQPLNQSNQVEALPEGWEMRVDQYGRHYFVDQLLYF
jgi:hypothetical protein